MIRDVDTDDDAITAKSDWRGTDGRRRPHSVGRTLTRDERGVSIALTHALTVAITSLLLMTLLLGATDFLQDERQATARQSLETVGSQLASEITRADTLYRDENAITVTTTQPERIIGNGYTVRLDSDGTVCQRFDGSTTPTSCLVLTWRGEQDIIERIPVQHDASSVTLERRDGGTFEITVSGPTGTPETERVGIRSLSVGVGGGVNNPSFGYSRVSPNIEPQPRFFPIPAQPTTGRLTTFDAHGSSDPDGTVKTFEWHTDSDGVTDATGPMPRLNLTSPGTRDVTLTVGDDHAPVGHRSLTKTVRISGLEYQWDLQTMSGGDGLEFGVENAWGRPVRLKSILVDPDDESIDELRQDTDDNDEIRIESDDDTGYQFDYWGGHDIGPDGRVFLLDDTISEVDVDGSGRIDTGDTATLEFENFDGVSDLEGEGVRFAVNYVVDGESYTTQFYDTANGPAITHFDARADGDLKVTIESSKVLDSLAFEVTGPSGTTSTYVEADTTRRCFEGPSSDFGDTSQIPCSDLDDSSTTPGFARYTWEMASPGPGQYDVTITDAEGEENGVESADVGRTETATIETGPYTWSTMTHWDANDVERGVVHESFGDHSSQDVAIGYPSTDRNGNDLVAYWSFDEDSGTVVEDASSFDNNGQLIGSEAPDIGRSGTFGTTSFAFDGTDDHVANAIDVADLGQTASLSVWIKTDQTGSDTVWNAPGITGVEQDAGSNDIFWGWIDGSGRIGIQAGNGDAAKSTDPINDDTWHHVVLTRDEGTGEVEVYVDGVLEETTTSQTGEITTDFASIGRIENTDYDPVYYRGKLDELRVYQRVLTDDQVEDLYLRENPGDPTGEYVSSYTTSYQSGSDLDGGNIDLDYTASVEGSEEIRVTVESGSGVTSDPVVIDHTDSGSGTISVSGLSGTIDNSWRLHVELISSVPDNSPDVHEVTIGE